MIPGEFEMPINVSSMPHTIRLNIFFFILGTFPFLFRLTWMQKKFITKA